MRPRLFRVWRGRSGNRRSCRGCGLVRCCRRVGRSGLLRGRARSLCFLSWLVSFPWSRRPSWSPPSHAMKTAVSRMNAASPSIVRERLSVSFAAVLELDGFEVVAVVVDVSGDAVLDAVASFVVAGVWVGASEDGDEASDGGQVEFRRLSGLVSMARSPRNPRSKSTLVPLVRAGTVVRVIRGIPPRRCLRRLGRSGACWRRGLRR